MEAVEEDDCSFHVCFDSILLQMLVGYYFPQIQGDLVAPCIKEWTNVLLNS